jgi:hypothetical protein
MRAYHEKVMEILAVDDFSPEELSRKVKNRASKDRVNTAKKVIKKKLKKKK